jgi:hypothetical protein
MVRGAWSTDQEAFSFFANCKLIRTYQIKELIDDPLRLENTVSHFFWAKKGRWFDDRRLRYTVVTVDGNQFVFDVRTGEMLSKSPAPTGGSSWEFYVVLGIPVLCIILWLAERRWRRAQIW